MTTNTPVIDFHVHALHPEVFRQSTNKTVFTGFGANPVSEPRPGAKALLDRMFSPEPIIEDMTARGIRVNATVSFTVPQALAVSAAFERGLKRARTAGHDADAIRPYITLMIGRVLWDEFFSNNDWPMASTVAVALIMLIVVPLAFGMKEPPIERAGSAQGGQTIAQALACEGVRGEQ